ncbi:MAG TPA: DUF4832 domain-containing protein [Fimbriimonas sp.]|nr:DUF4832 domain-containing protein [Fimbriimonas sp.]
MLLLGAALAIQTEFILANGSSPVDNPLKGLVPYVGQAENHFPCSMEFSYLPLDKLVVGKDKYDWKPIESLLEDVRSRGRQTVLRIYIEYPGNPSGIPSYLIQEGLKTTKWQESAGGSEGAQVSITPDYEDPRLIECIRKFVAAFGAKYDGDPRLGFITMGLLGSWGEWHTYPKTELFASKRVQEQTINAFGAAFKTTPILMRYPVAKDSNQAENISKNVGYHDDSFAWATLDTGKPEDSWFFMPALKQAGGITKWKTNPIGGEIRPEAWGICFDPKPNHPQVQDFETCVKATHVSWLMDSGMFRSNLANRDERIRQASKMVRLMGYDFHVPKVVVSASGSTLEVGVDILNRGVAPFFAHWPLMLRIVDADGTEIVQCQNNFGLKEILPGTTVQRRFAISKKPGKLQISCPNPMSGGKAVKFANAAQDQDSSGWLTIGTLPK